MSKGPGQLDYVVSAKRRDFSEYDRKDLHAEAAALVASLGARVAELERGSGKRGAGEEELAATGEDPGTGEPLSLAPGPSSVAIAGLVVATLALILAAYAVFKSNGKGNGYNHPAAMEMESAV